MHRQRNRIGEIPVGHVYVVHAFPRASSSASQCVKLAKTEAELGLSCVSLREIAWKQAQGKLDLGKPLLAWLSAALTPQIRLLTITPEVAADSAHCLVFRTKIRTIK
jgi:PIN domain nuclease of toxin-antitoxin system